MGVCVKGMYLPPSCYFCPMTNDGLYLCKANNPYKQLEDDCEERRPNWCPLVEVPEPHGRLGDLDELAKRIERERFHHSHTDGLAARHHVAEYGHFLNAISEAPTVIPAEPAR